MTMGSILSPLFDLPGLVVVESGFYHIQSAQPGRRFDQYLSMPGMEHDKYIAGLPKLCKVIAPLGWAVGVTFTALLIGILISPAVTAFLFVLMQSFLLELSETKTTWEIQADMETDGRFRLLGVKPDRHRNYLESEDHQVEMVAIKAGDNGEVYLKVLWDDERSKWLHPRGKAKKYVGLSSSRQWKWKLTPSNDEVVQVEAEDPDYFDYFENIYQ